MKNEPSLDALTFTRSEALQVSNLPGHTVDHAIRTGELPAIRSGRRFVILREDLIAWLRRCRERGIVPTPAPTQAERERLAGLNSARRESPA